LFQRTLGFDLAQADDARLHAVLAQSPYAAVLHEHCDRALLFDCLYLAFLEPALAHAGAVLLYDYPREQRAYARLSSAHTAARCELVIDGLEVANGYDEITDVAEQAACFDHDRALRAARGLPQVEWDRAWLGALRAGMPRCAGAALGIERLLLALDGTQEIAAMCAFPAENDLSNRVSYAPGLE
jgi:lysyl-tRNA synthetase class 2